MKYSQKIIDEVSQWKLYSLHPCHFDGTLILSRYAVKVWAKSKQDAIDNSKTILSEIERESMNTASPIHGWDIIDRPAKSNRSDLEVGSPWDLAAKVLHDKQSKAGRSKSKKKSKASSENLGKARDKAKDKMMDRKRVLGKGLDDMLLDDQLDDKAGET